MSLEIKGKKVVFYYFGWLCYFRLWFDICRIWINIWIKVYFDCILIFIDVYIYLFWGSDRIY